MEHKTILRAVLTAVLSLLATTATAHDFEVDGIYFNYNDDGTASVTYKGSAYNEYADEYTGDVVIPSSVTYSGTTYSVASIGGSAFAGCSGLTSVTIPNSVTSIGGSAFAGCRGLTSVTIPNSVTSIGLSAFDGCRGLKTVSIGNSVTSIDMHAFDGCTGLARVDISSIEAWLGIEFTSNRSNPLCYAHHLYLNGEEVNDLVIPNSVTEIDWYVFYGCRGLTSITIPNSVTSIGGGAFYGCSSLTSVTIPNSVMSIGSGAFYGCRGLTSITIPNSVTEIDGYVFNGCSGLTSVTIPNSVASIGDYAFADCSGLTSLTIGNSVTEIGFFAFAGCSGLTSLTIPNSVTSIGDSTFLGCSGLTSLTIGNSVTSIGISTFGGCSGLTAIKVDSENQKYDSRDNCNAIIETENNTLFLGCKNSTIPNSVTSIGDFAFNGCSGLKSLTIPNSVTVIGRGAFYGCSGLTSLAIGNSVTSIGDLAFEGCSGLTSVTIPNSVTEIGIEAFHGCSELTSVTIPNSVTVIGSAVFQYCTSLEIIIVESGNKKFDSRENCNAIIETATNTLHTGCKNTIIPNSVTSIGDLAFAGCSDLTSITIPNSVTEISVGAFYDCSGLKKAIVKAITPPSLKSQSFNNYYLKLIVPAISKEEYKSAKYWRLFTNYADAEIMIITLGLEKNNASIKRGETIQLTANAKPVDATFADVFLWTSSNEGVATVDGNGVVTAIADCTATITAQTVDGSNLSAACEVSVGADGVEGVDAAAARIYSANGNIVIAATEDGEAAVYDFTGRLIKSMPVVTGDATTIPVIPGCYIVKTGATTQSLIVK